MSSCLKKVDESLHLEISLLICSATSLIKGAHNGYRSVNNNAGKPIPICSRRCLLAEFSGDGHQRVDFALDFLSVEYLALASVAQSGRAPENR